MCTNGVDQYVADCFEVAGRLTLLGVNLLTSRRIAYCGQQVHCMLGLYTQQPERRQPLSTRLWYSSTVSAWHHMPLDTLVSWPDRQYPHVALSSSINCKMLRRFGIVIKSSAAEEDGALGLISEVGTNRPSDARSLRRGRCATNRQYKRRSRQQIFASHWIAASVAIAGEGEREARARSSSCFPHKRQTSPLLYLSTDICTAQA